MKKIMLPLILLGVLSSYSIAHEPHEKEIKESSQEEEVNKSSKEKKATGTHHSGRTNSAGCHNEKWGGYHCH